MSLSKFYNPREAEPRLQTFWQEAGIYHFKSGGDGPVYSIDTPPPTISGNLHLGHTYSYTHADLFARFRRMRGDNVFYPMGFDDNGLPTERLVERTHGVTAAEVGRGAFIEKCLQVSEQAEADYRTLFQRMGLSVDWRYTYRTIDECARRTCQTSFLELYRQGLIYRAQAPVIWCPECRTSLAQADINDLERDTQLITFDFHLADGSGLAIATTRPELLPACVAVFVHPDDPSYRQLAGVQAIVPLFDRKVPILADPAVDREKGTGAVMCCTFGDTVDKAWWYRHNLPYIEAIDREGRMTSAAGEFAGLPVESARRQISQRLEHSGFLRDRQTINQVVPVHERCDTPVEYRLSQQWFIRILEFKDRLLAAGEEVEWHPRHMGARYREWVENLAWDWCISRQRTFGVPFPLWYCQECGQVILAAEDQLPVDPAVETPSRACDCGGYEFAPEVDVFDTWATSSMSPQIVGRWLCRDGADLYERVFPFSLRPQGHEIIRTWAFYTIVKSQYHFNVLPWKDVAISGWGIAGEGMGKISKSRGGGPMPPLEMIEQTSADAVRYWAASTGLGKDAVISEDKIRLGSKLVTKLWNVARFCERFLANDQRLANQQAAESTDAPILDRSLLPTLTPADRWILSRAQRLIRRVTNLMEGYDYAAAKNELEIFFWSELADNYLEMCKQRLYSEAGSERDAARFALGRLLLITLQLFAPFLPHVTEEIYQGLFARTIQNESGSPPSAKSVDSIHFSLWPAPDPQLEDDRAEAIGALMVAIATAVRRYKSQNGLPLGTPLERLQLVTSDSRQIDSLREAETDLKSITRAAVLVVNDERSEDLEEVKQIGDIHVRLQRASNLDV
jgi:valyl-tRNA synthetase